MSAGSPEVQYLVHHRIPELIEDLLLQLLTSRPAHPLAFLCNALAKRHALTEGHDASHDGQQFSFVQVADVQLGFIDNPACDPAKPLPPGSTWSELAMVDALVQQVNALDPAFVVACGDHTHAEPTQEAHSELYRKQVAAFRDAFIDKLHPPVICVCGNHDIMNTPTPESIRAYELNFGTRSWFSFKSHGCHCVVLSSTLFMDPSGAPEEAAAQWDWLAAEVGRVQSARARFRHVFVFLHHPLFVKEEEEGDVFFFASGRGGAVNIPLPERRRLLHVFDTMRVSAVFAGHYHRNAVTTWQGPSGPMLQITTGAAGLPMGGDPSGFRVVTVNEGGALEHRYVPVNDKAWDYWVTRMGPPPGPTGPAPAGV